MPSADLNVISVTVSLAVALGFIQKRLLATANAISPAKYRWYWTDW